VEQVRKLGAAGNAGDRGAYPCKRHAMKLLLGEHVIAVVPLSRDSASMAPSPHWDGAVIIKSRKETGASRRLFYETVSKMDWLPATLRRAIDRELGISPRERKKEAMERQTAGLRYLINQTKARMRKNGERPRGGIHDAAVDEIAKEAGRKSPAVKQQLKRYKKYRLSKKATVEIT
jgi:hypothetical protein